MSRVSGRDWPSCQRAIRGSSGARTERRRPGPISARPPASAGQLVRPPSDARRRGASRIPSRGRARSRGSSEAPKHEPARPPRSRNGRSASADGNRRCSLAGLRVASDSGRGGSGPTGEGRSRARASGGHHEFNAVVRVRVWRQRGPRRDPVFPALILVGTYGSLTGTCSDCSRVRVGSTLTSDLKMEDVVIRVACRGAA